MAMIEKKIEKDNRDNGIEAETPTMRWKEAAIRERDRNTAEKDGIEMGKE